MAAIHELTDDELTRLVERLTVYALYRMGFKPSWRRASTGLKSASSMTVRGCGPEDVAAEAIEYLIENPDRCPESANLETYLRSVIDSKASTLVECKENRVSTELRSPSGSDPAIHKPCNRKSHEDEVDDEEHWQVFKEKALKSLSNEPLLEKLFECLEADFSREECAEYIEISVEECDNARKRMRRKVEKACVGIVWRSQQ